MTSANLAKHPTAGALYQSNAVYQPSPRVRRRAASMRDTHEALGRALEVLSAAGRHYDRVESVAWDEFKLKAQQLTGDMRDVHAHYGNAVDEFGAFVTGSESLYGEADAAIASHNALFEEILTLSEQFSHARESGQTTTQAYTQAVFDGTSEALVEQLREGQERAAALAEQILRLRMQAADQIEAYWQARVAQQRLADQAAEALRGARDVSGLNDGFWGNLSGFLSGLLELVISVLKVIVMVLLVVLTVVTLVLTPLIGPGPAAGLLLLTIFVAGALFVAQVVRAALDCVDFGAFLAAFGAAALHFAGVVAGAFLGGLAGALAKGLLGSLGPAIAGAVAAAVKVSVQRGVTQLVDDVLVEAVLDAGGPEAREIYNELMDSPATAVLEGQAEAFGTAAAAKSGFEAAAERFGADVATDAAGVASDAGAVVDQLASGVDSVFGEGTADLLGDALSDFAGDVMSGENVGDSLLNGLQANGVDWLEQRADGFLGLAEALGFGEGFGVGEASDFASQLAGGANPIDIAFDATGLGGFEDLLEGAGLGDLRDYGASLMSGQDPLGAGLDALGGADGAAEQIPRWFDAAGREEVVAAAGAATPDLSWVGGKS